MGMAIHSLNRTYHCLVRGRSSLELTMFDIFVLVFGFMLSKREVANDGKRLILLEEFWLIPF